LGFPYYLAVVAIDEDGVRLTIASIFSGDRRANIAINGMNVSTTFRIRTELSKARRSPTATPQLRSPTPSYNRTPLIQPYATSIETESRPSGKGKNTRVTARHAFHEILCLTMTNQDM
jgi:hypothetical protein